MRLNYSILQRVRNGPPSGVHSQDLVLEGFTPEQVAYEVKKLIGGGYLSGVDSSFSGGLPNYLAVTLTSTGQQHLEDFERQFASCDDQHTSVSFFGYYWLVAREAFRRLADFVRTHFPHNTATCAQFGFDLTSQPVPVVPAVLNNVAPVP